MGMATLHVYMYVKACGQSIINIKVNSLEVMEVPGLVIWTYTWNLNILSQQINVILMTCG